jgi:tetratricopeptide (TPR) repeat protein
LWNVLDLDATEARLHEALSREQTDSGRSEVLTQLARVESQRGRHDAAHALVENAETLASGSAMAGIRVNLERGRILRLEGKPAEALPLFEEAYRASLSAGEDFIAADAAHMCALAGDRVAWTKRGLELADRSPSAARWRVTLLLNLGEWHWERGEHNEALEKYQAALDAPAAHGTIPLVRELARYGAGRALRALGRPAEAIPLLEQSVAWAEKANFTQGKEFEAELEAARRESQAQQPR